MYRQENLKQYEKNAEAIEQAEISSLKLPKITFQLLDIPDELKHLNNLEQHLIAMNIPFMKFMNLPKGGQHGIHGPLCVPSNTIETLYLKLL